MSRGVKSDGPGRVAGDTDEGNGMEAKNERDTYVKKNKRGGEGEASAHPTRHGPHDCTPVPRRSQVCSFPPSWVPHTALCWSDVNAIVSLFTILFRDKAQVRILRRRGYGAEGREGLQGLKRELGEI